MEWRGLAAAVLVTCLGPVQAAAAASPTPGVVTPADLSVVLVDPPGPDYVAVPSGTNAGANYVTRSGPLDLAAAAGNDDGVRGELVRDGFTRGYVRWWAQRGAGAVLVETVEEFKTNAGARDSFAHAKFRAQIDKEFMGTFDASGIGDAAYGYRVIVSSDSVELDRILFVKGNLLLAVLMDRKGQTSTDAVLSQAQKEYAAAPDETIDQARQPTGVAPLGAVPVALAIALGAVLVLAIAVVLLVIIAAPRRRLRTPTPADPLLSADRRYWWDGSTWRDAAVSVPDGAPRSPDGAYWFDGVAWRPVDRSTLTP